MSFVPCEQTWSILDGRLYHLLLIMCDCPLAFRHKKGGTFVEEFLYLGGDFCICGAIILYLGASLCIYFLAQDVFFVFDWVVHDRGRYTDLYMFLVSHCLLIYTYELFMICVFILCYVKSRSYFYFTYIFHICVYAFVKCFRKYTG